MKTTFLSSSFLLAVASATPTADIYSEWKPPGQGDVRGPCPVVNTLANHGFVPRNGRNFTEEVMVKALSTALNFDPPFAALIWSAGLVSNPIPNATFWDLEGLSRHNVLEHDASLSRADDLFGSNVLFNETVWAETNSYWPGSIINAQQMANAKVGRQFSSKLHNPTYKFTNDAEGFSIGEVSSPFLILGDREAVTVEKRLLDYLIRNERFPTELGWQRPKLVLQTDQQRLGPIIRNASSLLTEPLDSEEDTDPTPREPGETKRMKRADPHGFDLI